MRVRRSTAVASGVLGVVLLAGGVAAAGTTQSPAAYAGCIQHDTGVLYGVTTGSATCLKHDTAISWNNAGPKGDQGPQGVPGLKGPAGAAGAKGDTGAKGDPGESAYQLWLDQGNSGSEADFLASLKGEKGDTGPAGPQGDPGSPGTGVGQTQLKTQTVTSPKTGDAYTTQVCSSTNVFGQCDGYSTQFHPETYAQSVTAVATCPDGTAPVTGGGTVAPAPGHTPALFVNGISTSSGGAPGAASEATSWAVTYTDGATPNQPWSVTSRVLCVPTS